MILAVKNDDNNFEKTLQAIVTKDKEFIITRHILRPGKKTNSHLHPKAREWIRIRNGQFRVTVGDDTQEFDLCDQPMLFNFHPKSVHSIEAISKIHYLVVRNKKDDIIYLDGQNSIIEPKWYFSYFRKNEKIRVGGFTSQEDAEMAQSALREAGIPASMPIWKE